MRPWYPGHMKAARKEIAEAMRSSDLVLELLDARMPLASSNPVLTTIRGEKPCLKVLTKTDLADAVVTRAWVAQLEAADDKCRVLELSLIRARPGDVWSHFSTACRRLAPHRDSRAKPVRALVVGIPNVGKSTLMNVLSGRKVAPARDQPGVTRAGQQARLRDGTILLDTAGILSPQAESAALLRLALSGAIPEAELDHESVGAFAAALFLQRYPGPVCARYGLANTPATPHALLECIGRRHGGLSAGGRVDLTKASRVLIHDFRSGKLGRISLEAPLDSARNESVDELPDCSEETPPETGGTHARS